MKYIKNQCLNIESKCSNSIEQNTLFAHPRYCYNAINAYIVNSHKMYFLFLKKYLPDGKCSFSRNHVLKINLIIII